MSISAIKMFFVRIGGKDYPISYNDKKNFGFDSTYDESTGKYTNYGDPIYNHSLSNVINNFDDPLIFYTSDGLSTNKVVFNESILETSDNSDIKNINSQSTFMSKVINLIEFIYTNQTDWKDSAQETSTDSVAYTCRGDEVLRAGGTTYENVSGSTGVYVKGTLKFGTSSSSKLKTRALYCTFTVTRANLTTDEKSEDGDLFGTTVSFTVYFNPDTYIQLGATTNYAVYSYEDLKAPTDEIDDSATDVYDSNNVARSEFESAVILKIQDILSTGKYVRVKRFCPSGGKDGATFYINKGTYTTSNNRNYLLAEDGTTEIDSTNMTSYGFNKVFYIFTSLDETQELDNATILKYIREYVIDNLYPGDTNAVERTLRFPNLFTTKTINIYPILNCLTAAGSPKAMLDGDSLEQYKSKIGIINNDYEIFNLGKSTASKGTNDYARVPLLAVENDTSSTSGIPISNKFSDLRPIYSSTDVSDMESGTIRFHDLCVLALSILKGDTTISNVDKTATSATSDNGTQQLITDDIALSETAEGYDAESGQTVYHSVKFTYGSVVYKFNEVNV